MPDNMFFSSTDNTDSTGSMHPAVITLDGPAGVGKSTMAKRVAQVLDIAYLDTGAMFRATALRLQGRTDHTTQERAGILQALSFHLEGSGAHTVLLLNGKPVGQEIRTEEVAMMASCIAGIAQVRDFQKTAQQDIGQRTALVAEGRDMGTVVFPAARVKIFLEATAQVRARRRYAQLVEQGHSACLDEILRQIQARDTQDTSRTTAPLCPAPDAVIVDTSLLAIDEVFTRIMEVVREKIE